MVAAERELRGYQTTSPEGDLSFTLSRSRKLAGEVILPQIHKAGSIFSLGHALSLSGKSWGVGRAWGRSGAWQE